MLLCCISILLLGCEGVKRDKVVDSRSSKEGKGDRARIGVEVE